jgi:hypothetical protein
MSRPITPQHPAYALGASPVGLLDSHGCLRLVTDAVHEDDALCLALTCRALRDALWARFPRRPASDAAASRRRDAVQLQLQDAPWDAATPLPSQAPVKARSWAAIQAAMNGRDGPHVRCRLRTRNAATLSTVSRLTWVHEQTDHPTYMHGWDRKDRLGLGPSPWDGGMDPPTHSNKRALVHICVEAARASSLEVLQWMEIDDELRCVRSALSFRLMEAASGAGQLAVLKWLLPIVQGCEWYRSRNSEEMASLVEADYGKMAYTDGLAFCQVAAAGGHLEVLQFLRANDFSWDYPVYDAAAGGGHLRVLRWMWETMGSQAQSEWSDAETVHRAALGGHLAVLQWLREKGSEWDELTCESAALEGHLEVLQWARANGAPWDEQTSCAAAGRGHLGVLQWLRANGCPWDAETCGEAVWGGHVELLQWARASGCPWNRNECLAVARQAKCYPAKVETTLPMPSTMAEWIEAQIDDQIDQVVEQW